MDPNKLFGALKDKLQLETDKSLEEAIGITQKTIISWKNMKMLSEKQVALLITKAMKKSEKNAMHFSIKPIVEYHPIDASDKSGKKLKILNTSIERCKKLKEILVKSHGIYTFYNSQCKVIYVGKANILSLWDEINNTFNKKKDALSVWQVDHPTTGVSFEPAYEKPRKIVRRKVYLYDIAHYFSAYQVEKDLINNAEAMLIRAFANDLINVRMENIMIK